MATEPYSYIVRHCLLSLVISVSDYFLELLLIYAAASDCRQVCCKLNECWYRL